MQELKEQLCQLQKVSAASCLVSLVCFKIKLLAYSAHVVINDRCEAPCAVGGGGTSPTCVQHPGAGLPLLILRGLLGRGGARRQEAENPKRPGDGAAGHLPHSESASLTVKLQDMQRLKDSKLHFSENQNKAED